MLLAILFTISFTGILGMGYSLAYGSMYQVENWACVLIPTTIMIGMLGLVSL